MKHERKRIHARAIDALSRDDNAIEIDDALRALIDVATMNNRRDRLIRLYATQYMNDERDTRDDETCDLLMSLL